MVTIYFPKRAQLKAMPMYALGVVPLIKKLADIDVSQMWYADDASACWGLSGESPLLVGSLDLSGPDLGYFPKYFNAVKTCFIVKLQHLCKTRALFRGINVVIIDSVFWTLALHWALMNL